MTPTEDLINEYNVKSVLGKEKTNQAND